MVDSTSIKEEENMEPLITSEQIKALGYEQYLTDASVIDVGFHGRTINPDNIDLSDEEKSVCIFISSILQMYATPDDPAEPYGAMVVMQDKRSMIPSDIEYEQILELARAVPFFSHAGIRARIADIVWLGNRSDHSNANVAIQSYIEAVQLIKAGKARHHSFDKEPAFSKETVELLRRAFQIAHALKNRNDKYPHKLANTLQDVIDDAVSLKRVNLYYWAMQLAYDCKVGDMKTFPEQLEKASSWNSVDPHWAKQLLELAAISYRSLKEPDDANRCWMAIAEKSVEIAESGDGSSMYKASWLLTAIEEVRRVRGPEAKNKAEELRKRLRDVQEDVHFEMGMHSYDIDLTDIINDNLTRVKDLSWGEVLGQFSDLTQSSDPEKLKDEAEGFISKHPMSSIFPVQKVDREGKVVSKRSGMLDETKDDTLMDQMSELEAHKRQLMVSGSLKPIRAFIQSETTITPDDFLVICSHSPFVPEGYEEAFALGFTRFFQGDMVSAASILIPMLENSIRYVLKTSGVDTSKIESDMTQEDSALSRLLEKNTEQLEVLFGKSIFFELDLLFNNRHGPRIRHEQAHGKFCTGNYYSDDVIYACWFLYRLTCLPLFKYWKEISAHINEMAEGRSKLKPKEKKSKAKK